jgi:hypothetical protein
MVQKNKHLKKKIKKLRVFVTTTKTLLAPVDFSSLQNSTKTPTLPTNTPTTQQQKEKNIKTNPLQQTPPEHDTVTSMQMDS